MKFLMTVRTRPWLVLLCMAVLSWPSAARSQGLGAGPLTGTLADTEPTSGVIGLGPIKLNVVVVMRGVNDDEVVDFARLTLDHPWHVRFIELMPVGSLEPMTEEMVVPSDEILSRIADVLGAAAGEGPTRDMREHEQHQPERRARSLLERENGVRRGACEQCACCLRFEARLGETLGGSQRGETEAR